MAVDVALSMQSLASMEPAQLMPAEVPEMTSHPSALAEVLVPAGPVIPWTVLPDKQFVRLVKSFMDSEKHQLVHNVTCETVVLPAGNYQLDEAGGFAHMKIDGETRWAQKSFKYKVTTKGPVPDHSMADYFLQPSGLKKSEFTDSMPALSYIQEHHYRDLPITFHGVSDIRFKIAVSKVPHGRDRSCGVWWCLKTMYKLLDLHLSDASWKWILSMMDKWAGHAKNLVGDVGWKWHVVKAGEVLSKRDRQGKKIKVPVDSTNWWRFLEFHGMSTPMYLWTLARMSLAPDSRHGRMTTESDVPKIARTIGSLLGRNQQVVGAIWQESRESVLERV